MCRRIIIGTQLWTLERKDKRSLYFVDYDQPILRGDACSAFNGIHHFYPATAALPCGVANHSAMEYSQFAALVSVNVPPYPDTTGRVLLLGLVRVAGPKGSCHVMDRHGVARLHPRIDTE